MSGTEYNLTPKLGLYKPITNMDANNWGTHWNANADQLDRSVIYDTRGNVGISVLPPANQAPSSANVNGGWVFGWGLTANNWATNGYYDGSAWHYLNADTLWQQQMTGTQIIWQFAPSGTKDATASLVTKMTLNSDGNLTLSGQAFVQNGLRVSGADSPRWTLNETDAPANQKFVDAFLDANGSLIMQFVNDAFNVGDDFLSVTRTGINPSVISLMAPTINLNGNTNVSGAFVVSSNYSAALEGGSSYAIWRYNNSLRRWWAGNTDLGNFVFYDESAPRTVMTLQTDGNVVFGSGAYAQHLYSYGSASVASGIVYRNFSPANTIGFGWDGTNACVNYYIDGTFQNTIASRGWSQAVFKDINSYTPNQDVNYNASPTFWNVNCHNVYASDGLFQIAPGYYLARNGSTGNWYFTENNQWNFAVYANGDTDTRLASYAQHQFARGNVYWGNDWAHILGNGGNGQYMQFAPGYYWTYNNSTGDMLYVMNNANQWVIHANSSCYNDRNWTGGRGPYVDISDIRGKRDIEPATYGLREILRLEPIRFHRIRENDPTVEDREEVSFSAQDVREVIPHAIFQVVPPADASGHCGEPMLGLATTPIVAALVRAVQELTARIEDLEARR